jgi:RecA-family ATPase
MLDGDPGLGKTTLALDLTARLSRGHALPDGASCEAGGAVILTAEDDAADTIRPRLEAAGADLGKILYLDSIPDEDGNDGPVSIPEHLPEIERAMARVNARLLVVDPIMAFFSGKACLGPIEEAGGQNWRGCAVHTPLE